MVSIRPGRLRLHSARSTHSDMTAEPILLVSACPAIGCADARVGFLSLSTRMDFSVGTGKTTDRQAGPDDVRREARISRTTCRAVLSARAAGPDTARTGARPDHTARGIPPV